MMAQPPSSRRGYAIALIATVLWSTTAIFIGYLSTNYHVPPLVVAFWRDLFVALGVGAGLRLLEPGLLVPPAVRRHLGFFVLYGFTLASFNALWTTSVALNGAAVSTVLAYSSPALTALLGWRLFGERLNAAKIVAVGLSITGCILISGAYSLAAWQVNPLGIALGLLAGGAFAAYSLFGKASSRRGINAWTAMFYSFSFGTLFLLLLQRPATIFWLGANATGWGILVLLAVGPTLGGYGLYTLSLTYLPASVASLIATLEPPLTAGLAFLLLGERLTGLQLAGGGLILLGVLSLRVGKASDAP